MLPAGGIFLLLDREQGYFYPALSFLYLQATHADYVECLGTVKVMEDLRAMVVTETP